VALVNEKQKKFANYYIKTLNATESAIKAGYSEKTAYSMGSENLTKPEIRQYIDEKLKKLQDKTIADAQEVMRLLTKMARGETEEEVVAFSDGESYITKKKVSGREQVKAQELLGKRYRLFADKIDITVDKPLIIDDIKEDDEDETK